MVESLVTFLQQLPELHVLLFAFLICYIENLFPPSPSDVLLVFAGTMVGFGTVGFVPLVAAATLGSVTGFATAYWLGRRYREGIIAAKWLPFITQDLVDKIEGWFNKYHGLVIVGNRFMAGTRAVIAFCAGITHLPFPRTILYCTISALGWNTLLVWLGQLLGENWRDAEKYIGLYGWIITGIIVVVALVWWLRKRSKAKKADV